MNTKHLLMTAGVATALAGCAAMGPAPMGVACTGNCPVTVAVKWNPDTSCAITDPLPTDKLHVGRAGQPTVIIWQISGDNAFKFAQPYGMAFDKPGSMPPPGNVMGQNGAGGGRAVTLTDNHKDDTTKGSWAYSIYVTDGRVTCKVDPYVVND